MLQQSPGLGDLKIEAAGSTDLARAMLRLRDFEAIILDAQIPRLADAVSALRSEPRASGLPVLVVGDAAGIAGVVALDAQNLAREVLAIVRPTSVERTSTGPRATENTNQMARPGRHDGFQEIAALLSATTAPILGLDDKHICIYANDAAARLFACADPGDLLGRAGEDLVPAVLIAAGHGEILRFDGHITQVAAAAATPGPAAGRLATVLTLHDKGVEHQQQARLFLAQKMVAMGELTGGICHDFANLLTVVCGNLSEIVKSPDLSTDVHEMAEDALSAAVDGMNLTRRLVAVARERQMRPRAVDVGLTIGEFGRLLKRLVRRPVELDVSTQEAVHALLDRTQLESAVMNLVLNAQHAMPKGGRIRLEVDAISEQRMGRKERVARIIVRDEGIGMDKHTLDHATEPFYTTRPDSGGTGLGLAMVKNFCKAFAGALLLESTPGVGTCVTMVFPWVPEAAPRTQIFAKVNDEKKVPTRRALVVVPDARLRRYASRLLSSVGHHVLEAADATGAARVLSETRHLDVVLVDQPAIDQRVPSSLSRVTSHMSRPMDLFTWLGKTYPDLPIVVTTSDDDIEKASAPGVRFLRKPYSESELARALRDLENPTR